jgi:hypothetical protein
VARFGLFWVFLIKLLAKKGRNTMGYGVKIMKVNKNNASTDGTIQRTKDKLGDESELFLNLKGVWEDKENK